MKTRHSVGLGAALILALGVAVAAPAAGARPAAPTPGLRTVPAAAPLPTSGEVRPPSPSPPSVPPGTPLGRLQAELEAIAAAAPGRMAFAVQDLVTGDRVVVDGDQVYHPASTIKVPLVMYLYDQAAAGGLDLQERMTYLPEDSEPGTGVLQARGPGESYTLETLAELTIVYSDNVAKNMLTRRLGWENMTRYAESRGFRYAWEFRRSTASEALPYLAELYARRGEPYFNRLLWHLQSTAFAPRLAGGFPADVPVAHKIGTQTGGQFHDVALVLLPGRPFAMAGFSQGMPSEQIAVAWLGRGGQAALATFQGLEHSPAVRVQGTPIAGALLDGHNRVQVPVRALAEALGAALTWEPQQQEATLVYGLHTLRLRVGVPEARMGNETRALGRPPFLWQGRLYAPLRALAEVLGLPVTWHPERQEVQVGLTDSANKLTETMDYDKIE